MIPDITFKEFVNNLFDYTKTPLENRNWITATKDNLFTYAYTWAEIEDYINKGDYAVLCSSIEEWNAIVDLINKNHVSTTTQPYYQLWGRARQSYQDTCPSYTG